MKNIFQYHWQISVVCTQSNQISVKPVTELTEKQHENICNQSHTIICGITSVWIE